MPNIGLPPASAPPSVGLRHAQPAAK